MEVNLDKTEKIVIREAEEVFVNTDKVTVVYIVDSPIEQTVKATIQINEGYQVTKILWEGDEYKDWTKEMVADKVKELLTP